MRWIKHEWYAQSNSGYRIAKSGIIPMYIKYVCYCPKRTLIGGPVYSFAEARVICEEHYDKSNEQTADDII